MVASRSAPDRDPCAGPWFRTDGQVALFSGAHLTCTTWGTLRRFALADAKMKELGEPGQWHEITIDDYVPVYEWNLRPCFAKAFGNEMWVSLLEVTHLMHGCLGPEAAACSQSEPAASLEYSPLTPGASFTCRKPQQNWRGGIT